MTHKTKSIIIFAIAVAVLFTKPLISMFIVLFWILYLRFIWPIIFRKRKEKILDRIVFEYCYDKTIGGFEFDQSKNNIQINGFCNEYHLKVIAYNNFEDKNNIITLASLNNKEAIYFKSQEIMALIEIMLKNNNPKYGEIKIKEKINDLFESKNMQAWIDSKRR